MPLPRPNLKADYAEHAKRYGDEPADTVLNRATALATG
jgi:hypothetical protein